MNLFLQFRRLGLFSLFFLAISVSFSQNKIYTIQLLNESFLPQENHQTLISELSTQTEFSSKIIQFYDIPTAKERLALKDAGIELDDYIPNFAYIATFSKNRNLDVFNIIKVRAVFNLDSRFKLSPELYKKQYPEHTLEGEYIKVLAIYLGDKSVVREKVSKIGNILNHSTLGHNFEIQIPISKLEELLAVQEIKFVESINPPPSLEGTIFNTTGRTNWLNNPVNNLNIDGTGITVAVEEGGIYDTNDNRIEVEGRFTEYGSGTISGHKTGVIYRMAGAGNLNPINKGIAYGANVLSLNNNNSNNTYFSTVGLVSVNHSYGYGIGMSAWAAGTVRDQDIRDSIGPLHSWSAGNQSNNASTYGPYVGISGYANLTGGVKQAKNTFAVGSCNNLDKRSGFSSKGPAYDGRIKPDLMIEGGGGTSHAAPKISGVVGQLVQGYKSLNGGSTPHLSLIKTVLLNTCDDMENPGPDFRTGFGRTNVRRAFSVFQENRFIEASIANGTNNSHSITVPSNVKELRVLVHWADYPASTSIPVKALVNNLDMTVTSPGSITYFPWVLNPAPHLDSLGKPAIRALDNLNNVEQVTISNPIAGNYSITINGTLIPQGPQQYFLTYEFLYEQVLLTYPIGREHFVPGETEYIQWDSYGTPGSFNLNYSVDSGANWISIATGINDTVRGYAWTVPNEISGKVLVKLNRGSIASNSIETFNIMPLVQNFSMLWRCGDSALFQWDYLDSASNYQISKLGNKYMDSLTTTNNNFVLVTGLSSTQTDWLSVQAYGPKGAISRRVIAIEIPLTDFNCIGEDIAIETVMASSHIPYCVYDGKFPIKIKIRNTGTKAMDSIIVKFQQNNGLIYADTLFGSIPIGNVLVYTFNDSILLSLGVDSIKVWSEKPSDVLSSNDSALLVLISYSCSTVSLPYDQDFDSFTDCSTAWGCSGISCSLMDGWYNVPNTPSLIGDSIDWRTDHSGTATGNTGPPSDHTSGLGKYLYLETSTPCPNKDALVNSPCIDLTSSSFATLKFWYHMYGNTIGSLHVDVLSNGKWINDISLPIIGDQGNLWFEKTVDLSHYSGQKIVVRFRGKTGNGFRGDLAIDDISVNRFPLASFNTTDTILCVNQAAIFNNNTKYATSYKWSVSPATFSYQNSTDSSSFQPEVNFLNSGLYTVNLLATNSFGLDSLTKTSTIYIVPTAGAVTTIGATLTLASTGVLYKWVNCDSNYSFHPKDTNQSFTPIINGNYACIITTPEGCLDTTACFSINSVKLENVSKDAFEVKVYPNPVNEILTVEVLKQEIKGDISITIIDEIGRLVYFKKEMSTDENIKIPVNSFESGSYTLVLNSKSFSVRKKIIIVR